MIPSQYHRLKIFAIAALATACGVAGASSFQVDMEPLFRASGAAWDHPVAIDVRNDGPDAKGVLHVSGAGFSMDYPVVLPHGLTKRVIAYTLADYGETFASLDTDQGSVTKAMPFGYGTANAGSRVLMIGGKYGDLYFLETHSTSVSPSDENGIRSTSSPNQTWIQDSYCSPEDAPPRAVGYQSVQAIVLGPGSERLSDGAIAALKTWTLEGGTLVFIGQEFSPVLADARWQALLPATQFKAVTTKSDELASLGQRELNYPVTLLEPQNAHGVAVRSDGKTTISTESGFGAGRIVYLAFDPLDPSLKDWAGLSAAVTDIIRAAAIGQQELVSLWNGDSRNGQGYHAYNDPPGTAPPNALMDQGPVSADDPFSAKLPPTEQVFEILAVYFLAVVPLNFLILRKLKRAELAWFTAPVLSLAFASVLFRSAGHLYSEKLSTATQGVVLVHPGAPSSVFIGETTMFIPDGGRYDLAMKGIDSLNSIEQDGSDAYLRNNSREIDLNPVDTGQVTVPNMRASNLAFRQIDYRQQVPLGDLYSVSMHRVGPNAVCEVRNGGKTALTNAFVWVGKHVVRAGTVQAGETKTVDVDLTKDQADNAGFQVTSMDSALGYYGGVALQANLTGFRPGPQIGEQIAARTNVTLFVFSKDALGGIR